jgi:hypothetical protein
VPWPTPAPSPAPTRPPTRAPTRSPTRRPTPYPTQAPTPPLPTAAPTPAPPTTVTIQSILTGFSAASFTAPYRLAFRTASAGLLGVGVGLVGLQNIAALPPRVARRRLAAPSIAFDTVVTFATAPAASVLDAVNAKAASIAAAPAALVAVFKAAQTVAGLAVPAGLGMAPTPFIGSTGGDREVAVPTPAPEAGGSGVSATVVAAGVAGALLAAAAVVVRQRRSAASARPAAQLPRTPSARPLSAGGDYSDVIFGGLRNAAARQDFEGTNPMAASAARAEHATRGKTARAPQPLAAGAKASAKQPAPVPKPASMVAFAPLPPGWFEQLDAASGKLYYYTEGGDVSWVRPTVSFV